MIGTFKELRSWSQTDDEHQQSILEVDFIECS